MTSEQMYEGKGNNAQPNDSTVNSDQQTPLFADQRQPLTAEEIAGSIDGALTLLQYNRFAQAEAVLLQMRGRFRSLPLGQANALSESQTVVPVVDEWQGSDLQDYLQDSECRHNARLMVRAWFLAHSLQDEIGAATNPCGNRVNVYLYELLDDFLSQPVSGKGVAGE